MLPSLIYCTWLPPAASVAKHTRGSTGPGHFLQSSSYEKEPVTPELSPSLKSGSLISQPVRRAVFSFFSFFFFFWTHFTSWSLCNQSPLTYLSALIHSINSNSIAQVQVSCRTVYYHSLEIKSFFRNFNTQCGRQNVAQLAAEKLKEAGLCSYCCVKKSSTDEGMARGFPTTTYPLLSPLHETQRPQNHQDPAGPTHIFMFSFFFIFFYCFSMSLR